MTPAEETFCVRLHGRRIGVIQRRGDHTRVRLDEEYWEDPDRPVLGLWFEDSPRAEPSAALRLPPWFSNLLPEGRLRDWIARDRGTSPHREMELLAQVGHDLPGAVTVGPVDGPAPDWTPGAPARTPGGTGVVSAWRFSLAGVGLKFSLLQQGDRLTLPASGTGGDWIVKLPDARHPRVPRNEYAMMRLAGLAGIEVPDTALHRRHELPQLPDVAWPLGEDEAYAVRRFDRGPDRSPVHIEDLAQVRGFYPEDKYRGTFETVAALVHRGRDVPSLQEAARRIAFCVLVGNGDAHLKNWSLLYPDGRVPRLAPAYDLVATAPYRQPIDGPEDLGLKLGRSRRFEAVGPRAFTGLQRRLGAGDADLAGVVEELVHRVRDAWPGVAPLLDEVPHLQEFLDARLGGVGDRLLGR